jgi:hypothetical protein
MKRYFFIMIASLSSTYVAAEPIHFEYNSTTGNCAGCEWVQATGEITDDTTKAFENFLKTTEFVPHSIRLNSPGGSLSGGIILGTKFRELGFSTEVGASKFDPNDTYSPHIYSREPGICASACAYRQLNSKGEPIEYNWEDDAVVGGKIYLCKIALPDRKAAPREITVTVEY